jgi:methionine sulfoxide reductase heme-binding subunit
VRWLRRNWHRVLTHVGGSVPLVVMAATYLSGTLVNPIRYVILHTGTSGLVLLVASLACTPVRKIFGWQGAIQIRRALGLYSFVYLALHLWAYAVLENALDFNLIWRDLGERRSMSVGLVAFLLLIPLALTSTRGWQRRLGRHWRTLHRLVYLAVPLGIWHYLWLDRDIITLPLLYAGIVAILLAVRLPWARWFTKLRASAG